MTETIYALATPPGRGAVAVVRVSGSQAALSLQALTSTKVELVPRLAQLRTIYNPQNKQKLDQALVIYFAAPASFTGEDVVEYQLHGGHAVVHSVLQALALQPYHRLAQPGEFTRRAFEKGRLDLTEAEAIADLVDAQTSLQQSLALDQLGGSLKSLYEGWRQKLLGALAYLEADLDFPEEDLPGGLPVRVRPEIQSLILDLAAHLDDDNRGERLRDGINIVILGAPNAGKSSLMNVLAKRDVAIVSDIAGTTRDMIEVHLDLGGYPVVLVDTAGLRQADAHDPIEEEGIARAHARAAKADIKLIIFDGTKLPDKDLETQNLIDDKSLIVLTKSDISAKKEDLFISTKTGEGIDRLLREIQDRIAALFHIRDAPTLTRARHREALLTAHNQLKRALDAPLPELATEDVRLAMRALGSITGRVDVEDLLDKIFRDFCIGK